MTIGRYGPGVYHSNFASKCSFFAEPDDPDDNSMFFFVNKIPMKYLTFHQVSFN